MNALIRLFSFGLGVVILVYGASIVLEIIADVIARRVAFLVGGGVVNHCPGKVEEPPAPAPA